MRVAEVPWEASGLGPGFLEGDASPLIQKPHGERTPDTGRNHWVCWLPRVLGFWAQHIVDREGASGLCAWKCSG